MWVFLSIDANELAIPSNPPASKKNIGIAIMKDEIIMIPFATSV